MQIEKENDIILYKYDNQGNTLEQKSSKGVISYTYDIYNRTRQITTENGDVIKNKYDPLGFRYQKEVNGDTNRYIFDDWNVIVETNKEGEIKSREVRGYELLKKETDNKYYYYHQNEHGDVTHLTNIDGEIENSYSYDVFGSIREEKEAVSNYFKYSGEQYEKEIEQYYLRARFYNPVVGRFTQEDVYREDGLNLYVYVVNNPLLWVDPSGLAKCLYPENENDSNVKQIMDGLKNAEVEYKFNSKIQKMEPYMLQYEMNDDYKILLRKDVGDFNDHDSKGDHWNLEVQTIYGRTVYDLHVYIDANGNLMNFDKSNVYMPKRSPFRRGGKK